MSGDFFLLLVAIGLAMVVLAGGLLVSLLVVKSKDKEDKETLSVKRKQKLIDYGSVSVFFDKHRNAVVIPYVRDLFGSGRAAPGLQFLKNTYTEEQLGHAVRASMLSCRGAVPLGDRELMKKLNYTSWREFSKGRKSISMYCRGGTKIVITPTVGKDDGTYELRRKRYERILHSDVSNQELGRTILSVLESCR